MSQSLSCLLVHLIFSTKERHPFLAQNDIMLRTHAYLGGILREASCPSLTIGGTADHVHAFFHLSRTQHVAKIVETLKSHSSRWIKAQGIEKFAWQRGYGCFSVGQSQVQALIRYIQNQADHHLKVTFQDEFRQFLRRYEISFEEQYVWD
jgi:REP element-mobilizing transposase RayT